MQPINSYGRQLTAEEIEAGAHRDFVGGLWDTLGPLQLDFLVKQGLRPGHRLLDIGCGALRGGVHFVRYLDPDGYAGMDINASLLDAGGRELANAGLRDRGAKLLEDDAFRFGRFGERFDFAIAVSVFTHLPINHIVRCLAEVARVLAPGGRCFATVFESPSSAHLDPLEHAPGGVTTYFDQDPFHISRNELQALAGFAGLQMDWIGDWSHPRAQQMACFRHP